MATHLPITLIGDNFDQRHKYLNSLVNESYKNCEDFNTVKELPEKSPIDRLFKIKLASKFRNIEYIIENLHDDDMLFVSIALKATWLIEEQYQNIINPEYLEDNLYPKMITTAVSKMQHWIHLKLCDENRCKLFYNFYLEKNFELAIKFLVKCSKEVIENEFSKIMYKITPHYLKVLSEKSSKVIKIFFDLIATDPKIRHQYLDKAKAYFDTIRPLLKSDGDMVLDIAEKYFDKDMHRHKFSRDQTKVIMKHHKERFWKKPEMYTIWFLNTQALADSLDSEEAKTLVLKLAPASYLSYWFSYQYAEPFIKRLKPDERAAFKKKVFVEKDFGDIVEEWPYKTPEIPANKIEYETIFDDLQPQPSEYKQLLERSNIGKRPIRKKKGGKHDICEMYSSESKEKTLLDKLFEEFRFMSFGKTLYDLRKRISAESSPQNRQYMILVLVSKSGGKPDNIALLLELLAQHVNETANFRATIIRSLVKRAQVWRLPETAWDQLLKYGQGLGLDGKEPEAECFEGLHAVVIRSLVYTGTCDFDVKNRFVFKHFSTFGEYSLDTNEKKAIAIALPKMLHSLVHEKEFADQLGFRTSGYCIEKLIVTLTTYKINLEKYPGLIDTIAKFASKEMSPIDYILINLYQSKIARKQLFRYTFPLIRTDESHLNALKHDTSVLDPKLFTEIYGMFMIGADRFCRKLSIYFAEKNGLASKFLKELQAISPAKINGRLIAFLLNDQYISYLDELDAKNDLQSKLLASAIRGNAHLARPALDLDSYGWKKIGAKYVGCKLMKCRLVDVQNNIEDLLKWKRTARSAFALAKRTSYQIDIFQKLALIRPIVGLKCGLKLMMSQGDAVDDKVWKIIKPIIQDFDVTKPKRDFIVRQLGKIDDIPMKIRAEFSVDIYKSFLKLSLYHAMQPLCHVEILLPEVEESFVENFITDLLKNDLCAEKLIQDKKQILCTKMFVRILVKYLLLSKTEEEQKRKIETCLNPFLAVLDEIRNDSEKKDLFKIYFPEMLLTLKYSKVFLNTKYVSSLPIVENIITWMRKHFALEEHFATYAQLHLLMLFYKAVQLALEIAPDVYSDSDRRREEGVVIFGKIFGKYIASEINTLQRDYFETMPELYIESAVLKFLEKFNFSNLSSDLMSSLIKGIFEENTVAAYRLGIYLLNEKYHDMRDDQSKELINFVQTIKCSKSEWLPSILES